MIVPIDEANKLFDGANNVNKNLLTLVCSRRDQPQLHVTVMGGIIFLFCVKLLDFLLDNFVVVVVVAKQHIIYQVVCSTGWLQMSYDFILRYA